MSSYQMENNGRISNRKWSIAYRFVATLLFAALVWGQAGGLASAEDTVTAVEISSNTPTNTVYVNEDSIAMTLWATISGSTTKKDVTSAATWTSSNSAVSVTGGVVTASGSASSAVITGKYGGYTATIVVKAIYRYKSIEIRKDDTDIGAKASVQLGSDLSLKAVGIATEGGETDVTDDAAWSTSNSSVASVDGGEVTLNAPGTATITVSYLGRTDSVTLTVASPYTSLTLDQTGPIEREVDDKDLQLHATAQPKSGGADIDVTSEATWTSSNTSVATVDEDGLVSFVGVGTADITAAYLGASKSVTVVVRTPYEALRTTPDKTLKLSVQGGKTEVKAYVLKDAATQETVTTAATWTSSDLVVATVSVEGDKAYIVPKSAGTTTVKASYKGLTREIKVTVYPTVTSIKLAKTSVDTYVDETGSFPAVSGEALSGDTVDLSDSVTWSYADATNNDVVSIEDGGWKALKTGSVKLQATLANAVDANGNPLSVIFTVNVNKKVHLLIADTDSVSIITGQEVDYPTIHAVYEDGTEADLTNQISWESSSVNVFVNETTSKWKGLVAAKATMTGTYLNAKVKVQAVVEDEYIAYTIDPSSIELTLKKSKTIKVTGKTKNGKKVSLGSRIEWTSSDESLLTVNGASVKAVAEGTGKLTATFQGKTLSVPFTVKAKLTKLTASSSSLQLSPGTSATVKITALYENGKTVDVTSAAVWTASGTKVASVSKGVVTAIAKGSTTVKATYEGKTFTVRIKVSS
ncbi:Ig-like domain-containing protein [Cohnella thermotolerans]|uniref:Ig-like domain-containing protein n=1 Tax=Cohnella thermotolerans TaxID=329858 RepID=UPI000407B51C|nr:Ig-like domain-containing protein [Cohnella thermotolerans]